MKKALLAAAFVSATALLPALDNPFPDATIISPGVKLGYTIGQGFSWGIETSVLWRTGHTLNGILAHGPVLNLTWTPKNFHARAAWEIVSWFAGIEMGPALVSGDGGTHLGFGITPWVGYWYVVPYYTHTILPGDDLKEIGTYFKLPLCSGCKSGKRDFDWEDDD